MGSADACCHYERNAICDIELWDNADGSQTECRSGAETPHPSRSPPRGEGRVRGGRRGACLAVRTRRPLVFGSVTLTVRGFGRLVRQVTEPAHDLVQRFLAGCSLDFSSIRPLPARPVGRGMAIPLPHPSVFSARKETICRAAPALLRAPAAGFTIAAAVEGLPMVPDDSVTQWIPQLRTGDDGAAVKLWERYFHRLAGLARKRLQDVPRLPAAGEDLALTAPHTLCAGLEHGRFPDLADRDSRWRLLVTITARKARQLVRDECRQKRGGGQVVGEPDEAGALEHLLSREPTPEFAAEVAEQCRLLLAKLGDEELRAIALWKMEGAASEQIAARLGKALSTVERRLRLIRTLWAEEAAS